MKKESKFVRMLKYDEYDRLAVVVLVALGYLFLF